MSIPVPQILSWPMGSVGSDGQLPYAMGDQSIREVILNILLTRPGERLMRPEFGAGIQDFVHQPNNETTRQLMASIVRKSIEHWEPRIVLEAVDVVTDPINISEVHLTIRYHMRHSITPMDFSLTLNLAEAGEGA